MTNKYMALAVVGALVAPVAAQAGKVTQKGNTSANLGIVNNTTGSKGFSVGQVNVTGTTGVAANLSNSAITNLSAGSFANRAPGSTAPLPATTLKQGGTLNNSQYQETNTAGASHYAVSQTNAAYSTGVAIRADKSSISTVSLGDFSYNR